MTWNLPDTGLESSTAGIIAERLPANSIILFFLFSCIPIIPLYLDIRMLTSSQYCNRLLGHSLLCGSSFYYWLSAYMSLCLHLFVTQIFIPLISTYKSLLL